MIIRITLAALACAGLSSVALGQTTTTVTFSTTNDGGWTWGCCESVPGSGGNPGRYLRVDNLDTFAPQPRAGTGGSFVGDYRTMGVTDIGVDLITFAADFSVGGRPLTLMLIHDNGTPGDVLDDTAAYLEHPNNVPGIGAGWQSYDFAVPSQETTLPAGWALLNLGDSGSPANHTWDEVIQDVGRIRFFYGNPEFFFIFQQWTLGLDNVRFTVDPMDGGCGADVTGDGSVNIDDVVAVVLAWGTCVDCAEDINGDDLVNIDDIVEVVLAFGPCL
jgi:hypothetical protein